MSRLRTDSTETLKDIFRLQSVTGRTCGCMKSDSAQNLQSSQGAWWRRSGALTAGGGVADTYPHTFRIVFESVEPTEHRLPVLLPLPLAKDYFQEVPGPANQRDLEELVLGEHFGTLQDKDVV